MPDRKESLEKDCNLCHLIDFQSNNPQLSIAIGTSLRKGSQQTGLENKDTFSSTQFCLRDLAQSAELARLAMSSLL